MTIFSPPAIHSADLLGKKPAFAELKPALLLFGERLGRAFSVQLRKMGGADQFLIHAGTPTEGSVAPVLAKSDELAVYSAFSAGTETAPIVAVFNASTLFRFLDRAFGGQDEILKPLPTTLPLSAELLLDRMESALATAMTEAFGDVTDLMVSIIRRDTSFPQLEAFSVDEELLTIGLEIEMPGISPHAVLTIACPAATFANAIATPRLPKSPCSLPTDPDVNSEPFASIPIELTATLVDMSLSMDRLTGLRLGDVIPVPVARSIPLRAHGRTIATGTLGELDDRVAIQISNAF